MRAVVVLPQPREPANTNACAMRPLVIALRSVRGHRLLSDDVVEPLRPPFARKNLVGHLGLEVEDGRSFLKMGEPHRGPVHLRHTSGSI